MPERKFLLSRMLRIQGVLTVLIGLTWLAAESQGRLAGVLWLKFVFQWTDLPLDTIFAIGWIASGVGMIVGGFAGCKHPRLESAGYLAALCWPLFLGAIFLAAYAQGYAPTGYVSTISYTNFALFYIVYLFRNPDPQRLNGKKNTGTRGA